MARLTGPQIAAAMALAQMTQDQLAKAAGLGRNTLNRTINDSASTKDETLDSIRAAIEARGIEFTDQNGVRIKSQGVDLLIGQEGLHKFFDSVYEHVRQHGGTIVQFGVDEKQFLDHLGTEYSARHVKRMQALSRERKDLKVKAIICEGEKDFLAPDYNEYRWISKDFFQAVPFYICGETLAIMDFHTIPAPTIVLLRYSAITNAYRKQFEAFWKIANEMPQGTRKGKGK